MKFYLLLLFVVLSVAAAQAAEPAQQQPAVQIKLTSLDWPPYTGEKLTGQGEVTVLLRQVMADLGYQVQVDFLPWPLAVAKVRSGTEGHQGYFPEYPVTDPGYLMSAAIGYSELGLVERRDKPLLLTDFSQLSAIRFGVVQDYLNMAELDEMIAAGQLKPVITTSDINNVQKVISGQLQAAVIDKRVLNYLLLHEPSIQQSASLLQFSQSLRENRSLHLILKNTAQNAEIIKKFNQKIRQYKTRFIDPSLR
jgi:polar amino acid transport system substrate-binding protein